ncbi:hypothetical protein GLA29479_5167 [Lysobacter antibioticus]|nr:hypothetical protein GLA29479_5167 [Lysobacter antibioticus]
MFVGCRQEWMGGSAAKPLDYRARWVGKFHDHQDGQIGIPQ